MGQWYCFKCKEEMVVEDVEMTYLDVTGPIEGIKCPKCGTAYLLEKRVMEEVIPGEEMIEGK